MMPANVHPLINDNFYFVRFATIGQEHESAAQSIMTKFHRVNQSYHDREGALREALGYNIPKDSMMCRWYIEDSLRTFNSLGQLVTHLHKTRYAHEHTNYDQMVVARWGHKCHDVHDWKVCVMEEAVAEVGGYPRLWPWRRRRIMTLLRTVVRLIGHYHRAMARLYLPEGAVAQGLAEDFATKRHKLDN